jgi:hypothetical protein
VAEIEGRTILHHISTKEHLASLPHGKLLQKRIEVLVDLGFLNTVVEKPSVSHQ